MNQALEAVPITTVKVDKYLLKYGKVKLQMIRKPVKACYKKKVEELTAVVEPEVGCQSEPPFFLFVCLAPLHGPASSFHVLPTEINCYMYTSYKLSYQEIISRYIQL